MRTLASIFKNNAAILTLVSGTAIAQAVTFLASPVLSRLYTPLDFGEMAFYMFCLSAVQVVACARYEMAIVLADTDEEANQVIGLSWTVSLFFTFLSFVWAVFYQFLLPHSAQYPHLVFWFWLMPFAVFGLGTYMIFNQALIRNGRFATMSSARLAQSVVSNGLQVFLGWLKIGASGLFWGSMLSNVVYGGALFGGYMREKPRFWSNWSWARFFSVARKYESLPRTTFFQSLLEMFQANALSLLLPLFYGGAAGGFYFRTLIIFQAPVSLLGQALAQVTYREIAAVHQNQQNIQPLLRATMRKAALLILPISLGLILFGPWAFGLLFGEKWCKAGVYARILAFWMYFDFIRMTVVQVCIIINQRKNLLKISIFGVLLLVGAVVLPAYLGYDARVSLLILSSVMTVYTLVLLKWLDSICAAVAEK